MHATVEQLLSLRDGEPVTAECRRHVDACEPCADTLRTLAARRDALAGLPGFEAPPGAWDDINARLDTRAHRAPRRAVGAAIAATLLVTVAAGLLLVRPAQPPASAPADMRAAVADTPTPAGPEPAVSRDEVPLDEVMARSARLETLLEALNARAPRTMDASTAGTIATLEDRIAVLDYGLSHAGLPADRSEELWRNRVDLMNALVYVRGAQIQTGYHQIRSDR